MGTDISGIAKSVLQARVGIKTENTSKEAEEAMTISFMELMNQNSLPTSVDVSNDSKELDFAINTENSTKTAYDSCANQTKSVSVKKEMTSEEMQSKMEEPLESYEKEVRDVLKEELGVTDEEISEAMESLGMNFLDLRNVQNLTTLIQTLTGEDIGTLFLSEAFQNVMEQVTTLTESLCEELGITKEELNALCEALEQMQTEEPVENMEAESEIEIPDTHTTNEKGQADVAVMEQTEVVTVVQEEEPEQAMATEETNESLEVVEATEQTTMDSSSKETGTGSKEQSLSDQSQNAKTDISNSGMSIAGQQAARAEEFVMPQEAVSPYANQIDTADIIQQIARNVRVTISATTTSMEMQLNPENLGKVYLNVSERDGVVRAQLAVQNETVKEALEMQLVELRQSLNQQGVKVDAIEVTVATHEFEQNLEGNAKQEEQMQKQMEESQKQGRRNLKLDELDTLSGLMTEEEQLAAQIMRDNGNQVDLTA